MFGLSFSEIIIVILCIVIFVGPGEMPEFLRDMKKLYRYIKGLFNTANREYDDLKKLVKLDDEIDIDKVNQELTEIIGDDGNSYLSYGSPLKKEEKDG